MLAILYSRIVKLIYVNLCIFKTDTGVLLLVGC